MVVDVIVESSVVADDSEVKVLVVESVLEAVEVVNSVVEVVGSVVESVVDGLGSRHTLKEGDLIIHS